jgi:hypothetical protein
MARAVWATLLVAAHAASTTPSFHEQRLLWEDKSIDKSDASSVGVVRNRVPGGGPGHGGGAGVRVPPSTASH